MTEEELQTYLVDHCQVIDMFREKALEFQNDRNHERLANKRWPQVTIENEVNKMVDQFISNVHNNLSGAFKESQLHPYESWVNFIENHEILDSLEESVTDIDFA